MWLRSGSRLAARAVASASTFTAAGTAGWAPRFEFIKAQKAVAIRVEFLEYLLATRMLIPSAGALAVTSTACAPVWTFACTGATTRAFASAASAASATGTAWRMPWSVTGLELLKAQFAVAVRVEFLEHILGTRMLVIAPSLDLTRPTMTLSSTAGAFTAAWRLAMRD
jgi:hypothetical protein